MHSIKNTSWISMIQIFVKRQEIEVYIYFCDFSHCLSSTLSIGEFKVKKCYGCKMTEKD